MHKIICNKLEIKSISDDGSFTGYASINNVVDSYNDIILPGAFGPGLDIESVKLLWQHDPKYPIGVLTKIMETTKGLYIEAKLLTSIPKGIEAYELLKAKVIDGLSIGFEVIEHALVGEHRYISKLKLWEISVVTFPANDQARVRDVKTAFVESVDRAIKCLRSM